MFPLEAVWVEADLDGLLLSVDTNPWSKTMGAEGIDDSSAFATQAAGSSLARPPFLLVKRRPEGCWALDELQPQLGVAGGPEESGDDQTKPEELQKLLYIAESLRKREGPGGEE